MKQEVTRRGFLKHSREQNSDPLEWLARNAPLRLLVEIAEATLRWVPVPRCPYQWQVPRPRSVNDLPASGTNSHS